MADNHQVGADDAHSRDNPSDNSNDAADAHRRGAALIGITALVVL